VNLVHAVPDWYRALVPLTAGFPTPEWNLEGHLEFMEGLSESFFSFSGLPVYY